jgi:hypothetical protein
LHNSETNKDYLNYLILPYKSRGFVTTQLDRLRPKAEVSPISLDILVGIDKITYTIEQVKVILS